MYDTKKVYTGWVLVSELPLVKECNQNAIARDFWTKKLFWAYLTNFNHIKDDQNVLRAQTLQEEKAICQASILGAQSSTKTHLLYENDILPQVEKESHHARWTQDLRCCQKDSSLLEALSSCQVNQIQIQRPIAVSLPDALCLKQNTKSLTHIHKRARLSVAAKWRSEARIRYIYQTLGLPCVVSR